MYDCVCMRACVYDCVCVRACVYDCACVRVFVADKTSICCIMIDEMNQFKKGTMSSLRNSFCSKQTYKPMPSCCICVFPTNLLHSVSICMSV